MPIIDLREYIIRAAGIWQDAALLAEEQPFAFSLADTKTASRLMLRWPNDVVALTGPLRVRVTLQAENLFYRLGATGGLTHRRAAVLPHTEPVDAATGGAVPAGTDDSVLAEGVGVRDAALSLVGAASIQANTLYSYVLDIPAGQAWPFQLSSEQLAVRHGTNFGRRLVVEPAISAPECPPAQPGTDIACDFAVGEIEDSAKFFPVACEPCDGKTIGLPPGGPSLGIPPAQGGCVRPRFFDGMFITREDLETEQLYFRIKHRLQNRASGQGVVWGLGVGKSGGAVCVQPGYGVDCCGNDLVVTATYKVDIPTLLRDPLAAPAIKSGRPTRMHLLLEYLECPDNPRPVHADPCARGSDRCEMSRIRETVRLRLVPPRDVETVGPLSTFLDTVGALAKKYAFAEGELPAPSPTAPFELTVEAESADGAIRDVSFDPDDGAVEDALAGMTGITRLSVSVRNAPGWMFSAGTLNALAGEVAVADAEPIDSDTLRSSPRTIEFDVDGEGTFRWELADWVAESVLAPVGAPGRASTTAVVINVTEQGATINLADRGVEANAVDLAGRPCTEPCTPEREAAAAGRSPRPWLHADPIGAARSGDPKALVLAALGSWLLQLMSRTRAGTDNESELARRKAVAGLYQAAWLLLFGVDEAGARPDLTDAVRKLFRDWCQAFLYPGPICKHDPHGVVIGCTIVSGGDMGDIDPYGGRRYVVHYPLLAYWGRQVGLAPPDAIATRFFSLLCCVAGLPAATQTPALGAMLVEVGAGYLAFGAPEAVARKLAEEADLVVTSSETLTLAPFVAKFVEIASSDDAPGAAQSSARRYTLGGAFAANVLSLIVAD